MVEPASPELIAELDGRMVDVYKNVLTTGFDADMCDEDRATLYWLLRLAYAGGRHDGALEAWNKINVPQTYGPVVA